MSRRARIAALLASATLALVAAGAYVALAGTSTPATKDCRAVYTAVRPLHDGESAVVQADAAHSYARLYHVPLSVAYARMKLQDVAVPLVPAITAALATHAGGTWFDPADCGRLEVGVAGSERPLASHAANAARALAAKHNLAAAVHLVAVRWSTVELDTAYGKLSRQLERLSRAGMVEIHTDPATNAVVIETATTLTAGERSRIAAAARSATVTVDIKPTNRTRLGFKLAIFRRR